MAILKRRSVSPSLYVSLDLLGFFMDDGDRKNYKSPGRCIYGNGHEHIGDLSREHIIPYSLGGQMVIPKASCIKCAHITRDFERSCARGMFGPLRYQFGLPGKKKGWPTTLPIKLEIEGAIEERSVALADCPAVPVLMPIFGPPGILANFSPSNVFIGSTSKIFIPNVPDNDIRLKRLKGDIKSPIKIHVSGKTEIGPFARLLAKIAHSYSVAECGMDSFKPLLPDIILGRDINQAYLIGGCPVPMPENDIPESTKSKTHRMRFAVCSATGGQPYLCLLIQLFQGMKTPTYLVVVGIPTNELVQWLDESPHREGP